MEPTEKENTVQDTGERMMPESSDEATFFAHVYRYRFAAQFVRDKRVLDIASGEGYGTAALSQAGAQSVVGVDICPEICLHARRKYGVDIRLGDAERIPLPDQSVDVVVSFETIEHVQNPERFLEECVRVLTPHGRLIVSTPNREVYSENGKHNEFHHIEFNKNEFVGLLQKRFQGVELFTQRLKSALWCHPRSLAADEAPWRKVKGYWRFRDLVCPHLGRELEQEVRNSPARFILQKEDPLFRFFDPYSIWEHSSWTREKPFYWIAIASFPGKISLQIPPDNKETLRKIKT